MKDVMLADTPIEERAQILRDSCIDDVLTKIKAIAPDIAIMEI